MSTSELIATITELQEYRRIAEETAAVIEGLQDKIKAAMGTDEVLMAGPYKVTWKPVTTSRLDTKALTADHPDLVEAYKRTSITKRFTVQ